MSVPHHTYSENLKEKIYFTDKNQNFWQLASIQSAAFGFPILNIGKELTETYGAGTTVISICIGNLILWIIGLATVAMAFTDRKNAIENFKEYGGKIGAALGGLVLLMAFLFWFTIQLRSSSTEIVAALSLHMKLSSEFGLRVGAALGLFIALLSLGGIRFIKWFAVAVFPLAFLFIIYAILMNDQLPVFKGTWGISLSAIAVTVALTLPGIINLPTFFRHSRSRADAFLALTILTIFTSLIEMSSIWLMNDKNTHTFGFLKAGPFLIIIILLFNVLTLMVINFVNVYFASAVWETMLPRIGGAKEKAIIGMAGTIAFTFIQLKDPMYYIENILDSFLASLGIILLIVFLIRRIVSHRQRGFELTVSLFCWFVGCITAIVVQKNTSPESSSPFFSAIGASSLSFIFFLFIEETVWAGKNCLFKIKSNKF